MIQQNTKLRMFFFISEIKMPIRQFRSNKYYSPLPERPRLSLRTINLIQSGMPVRKCISGEKSDIILSNHNYGRRQIKAKWNNEEFGYFNTITKIANAILCSLFMFWL